ncbi:hypothetical protein GCM10025861_08490 [Methanobacterium petrolearium]|nr:hypothetical protein GCM10025861_08490 [Methanobacterium petrolearium]
MDEHVMEALGKSKVVIKGGKVVSVEKPLIDFCPLFQKYRGIEKFTPRSFRRTWSFVLRTLACAPKKEKWKWVISYHSEYLKL